MTTIELSTTKPTQIMIPIIVMTFRDQPTKYMTITAIISEKGIAMATASVIRNLRIKSSSTITANAAPHSIESCSCVIDSWISSA